ncbi:unnamed protein product [Ranitomeya imitator]|uniref:SOSS complex subunit C n=1 Tax=Ranitomeya imitator TaxID=111125 RepID=A0ABN9LJQ3_9NEOB|nr:unnamed protein product [Ranitomeya imitator]
MASRYFILLSIPSFVFRRICKQEQSCYFGRTRQREEKIDFAKPIFNKQSRGKLEFIVRGLAYLQPCNTNHAPPLIVKKLQEVVLIALARPNVNKDFRDHAEQQHIAAQQKAALQVCSALKK